MKRKGASVSAVAILASTVAVILATIELESSGDLLCKGRRWGQSVVCFPTCVQGSLALDKQTLESERGGDAAAAH